MKVIYGPGPINPAAGGIKFKKSAVAIGIFDGVHLGHRQLIKNMVADARKAKAKAVVITFFPHPAHVLRPDIALPYLMPLEHRLKLLQALDVDAVVVIRFNKKFAHIDPRLFIRNFLVANLHAQSIFVGQDFRFGKDRSGDIGLFKELSRPCGYILHAIKPVKQGAAPISSSRLRHLVPEGKLKQAQALLGRPVSVLGRVVKGSSRGKALGFPTANVAYACDVLPPTGVYAVRVTIKNKVFYGMANLGLRPSFKDTNLKLHLEVNIFNFKRNIYGQEVLVEFLKRIRDEKKFSSKEHLIAQIQKDEIKIRRFLRIK